MIKTNETCSNAISATLDACYMKMNLTRIFGWFIVPFTSVGIGHSDGIWGETGMGKYVSLKGAYERKLVIRWLVEQFAVVKCKTRFLAFFCAGWGGGGGAVVGHPRKMDF